MYHELQQFDILFMYSKAYKALDNLTKAIKRILSDRVNHRSDSHRRWREMLNCSKRVSKRTDMDVIFLFFSLHLRLNTMSGFMPDINWCWRFSRSSVPARWPGPVEVSPLQNHRCICLWDQVWGLLGCAEVSPAFEGRRGKNVRILQLKKLNLQALQGWNHFGLGGGQFLGLILGTFLATSSF